MDHITRETDGDATRVAKAVLLVEDATKREFLEPELTRLQQFELCGRLARFVSHAHEYLAPCVPSRER